MEKRNRTSKCLLCIHDPKQLIAVFFKRFRIPPEFEKKIYYMHIVTYLVICAVILVIKQSDLVAAV